MKKINKKFLSKNRKSSKNWKFNEFFKEERWKITMETLIRENNKHGKQPKEGDGFVHSERGKN